jgi:hypothetical protein
MSLTTPEVCAKEFAQMRHIQFRGRFAAGTVMGLTVLLMAWSVPSSASAQDNLLLNPSLSEGMAAMPDYWQTEAFFPDDATFLWLFRQDPAELEVSSDTPNDARWVYALHLEPGWYHFTASVRAENVPKDGGGATISLMPDGISAQQIRGTSDWHKVGLYVKAGHCGNDAHLACRLGGYSYMNTGKAFCREISAVTVQAPADDKDPVYDLDQWDNADPKAPCEAKPAS